MSKNNLGNLGFNLLGLAACGSLSKAVDNLSLKK